MAYLESTCRHARQLMAEDLDEYCNEKFTLPPDFDPHCLPDKDERVCVVSVIGKSQLNFHHSKATMINQLLLSDVFSGNVPEDTTRCTVEKPCVIEGFYDSKEHVIYLHLQSEYDACQMAQLCQKAAQQISSMGADAFWQSAEYYHARMLLFIFSLSHIILLVQPSNSFDVSYVRLFRVLDLIRQKLQHSITDQLRTLQVSKEWVLAGRLCSPRVLFLFESCLLQSTEDGVQLPTRNKIQKSSPLKKLQHAMEDQIYRVLRKSRIITNISNNSLFAVPANQEFVCILKRTSGTHDPTMSYLSHLLNICSFDPGGKGSQNSVDASSISLNGKNNGTAVREFLWQHIELAHSKGFDDNVGRNPPLAVFEMPSVELWFEVARKLLSFFTADYLETRARPHFSTLQSHLDISMRFSESRCQKVLPVAESAYQEGLPQHYTYSYHYTKVGQAKKVYMHHARGPATEKYMRQLELNCDNMWKGGRQLCEAVSLTGNHCVNELHRVDLCNDEVTEENKDLPVMPHTSPLVTKAYCNCGNKQAEREDPFDHQAANFDFYDQLEDACCHNLPHHKFPVWRDPKDSKKQTYSRAVLQNGDNDVLEDPSIVAISSRDLNKKKGDDEDITSGMVKLSLKKNIEREKDNNNVKTPDVKVKKHAEVSIINPDLGVEKAKFVKGIPNDKTVDGLLPKFPSWSLVCIGKYGSYTPSLGVEQAGFLHSTNFLLPWDVYIQNLDKEKWPTVVDSGFRRGKFRKGHRDDSVALRLYLGMEYECPRGHRFFCSSPDKIFKAPSSGIFKESAHRIVTNDMPLYFPCHCRSSKGYMAQLMRVFVAVPEGPVEVHLRPMVQPAPSPCPIFHPGKDPLKIPQGDIWVLRLPYIYMDDKGTYVMPRDPQNLAACRVLKGLFNFINTASANR